MTDINRVILVGRLVKDAELKFTSASTPVTRFSVAVNRSRKNGDQWEEVALSGDVVYMPEEESDPDIPDEVVTTGEVPYPEDDQDVTPDDNTAAGDGSENTEEGASSGSTQKPVAHISGSTKRSALPLCCIIVSTRLIFSCGAAQAMSVCRMIIFMVKVFCQFVILSAANGQLLSLQHDGMLFVCQ